MSKANIKYSELQISHPQLPVQIADELLSSVFADARDKNSPILAVVTGTKPDFYKQAPLVVEAQKAGVPVFVINTGQHFDDTLGFGIKEFRLDDHIACNLQIRGDLMEKASELILKFGTFGRYCRKRFGTGALLPVVHGDTLVAGIAPLAWVFGMGQKVGQNEAGLRSMSPEIIRTGSLKKEPTRAAVEKIVTQQLEGRWFLAREEPFPEQIDTWICSAGTQFFFASTMVNRENLIREGYPEDFIHVVGNSVVDAIYQKRKEAPTKSIFEVFPQLDSDGWIRVDIHRRENLTRTRFEAIVGGIEDFVRKTDHKIVLVMLNAMASALEQYGLRHRLDLLADEIPQRFLITPLWKEYANVIEFLDSGRCVAEMTDSGSLQEELLYFEGVNSMTVRLNTDRPETIFQAKSNILVPPLSRSWVFEVAKRVIDSGDSLGIKTKRKPPLYGKPGSVSRKIISTVQKEFENGDANFYPWLHQRLGLWKERQELDYM